jgi:hypothetical protein
MIDPVVRGYMLVSTLEYIESPAFDDDQRRVVYASLSKDVSRDRSAYDVMKWYPASFANELNSGMAAVHRTDEKKVYDLLEGLGMFTADKATSTFLRLLMKILTPGLFAKKAPDFWARDNRVGTMEADTSMLDEKRLVVHLRGISPLVHVAPSAAGFARFALKAIGLKNLNVETRGWSLKVPAPEAVQFDISWS